MDFKKIDLWGWEGNEYVSVPSRYHYTKLRTTATDCMSYDNQAITLTFYLCKETGVVVYDIETYEDKEFGE